MDRTFVVEVSTVVTVNASDEEAAVDEATAVLLDEIEHDAVRFEPRVIYEVEHTDRKEALEEMRDYLNGLHNQVKEHNPEGVKTLEMMKAWVKAKMGMLKE